VLSEEDSHDLLLMVREPRLLLGSFYNSQIIVSEILLQRDRYLILDPIVFYNAC